MIVGFLISGFGSVAGFISGCLSKQGHSGQVVHVQTVVHHVHAGQFALEVQLNSVNDSSPSNVQSTQVLISERQV